MRPLCQGYGASGGVAQAVVNSVESEGGYCSEVAAQRRAPRAGPAHHRPAPVGQGPRLRAPAEAARALAMDMGAVLGGLGVEDLLGKGIKVNGWRGT